MQTNDQSEPGQQQTLSILLVEDNAFNQDLALQILAELGYRADIAADGLEALAKLQERSYHIVLMDIEMPNLNGLETARRIRRHRPSGSEPYIIAMTAHTAREERAACLAAGMNDYVGKPLMIEDLQAAIERYRNKAFVFAATEKTAQAIAPADAGAPVDSVDSVLDPRALERLRSLAGSEAVFRDQFIATFLHHAPALLDQLRQSLLAQNAAALYRAAHSLKSNGASLGATRFSLLCHELEKLGKAGALAEAETRLAELDREYRTVSAALSSLYATQDIC